MHCTYIFIPDLVMVIYGLLINPILTPHSIPSDLPFILLICFLSERALGSQEDYFAEISKSRTVRFAPFGTVSLTLVYDGQLREERISLFFKIFFI